MRRREFIKALAGSVTVWPLAAQAQQSERMRRIGVLLPAASDDPEFQAWLGAFLQGLQQLGWSIGQNVRIETRWATSNAAGIRKHAAELAALAPDVILAHGASTVGPLLQITRTVPIVTPVVGDPVGAGFVDSLARPGGNITGFISFEYSMAVKWLELLKENRAKCGTGGDPSRPFARLRNKPVCCHRRRRANAQSGRQSDQHGRRGPDYAVNRDFRALFERWSRCDGKWRGDASSRSDRQAGGAAQTSCGLLRTVLCCCGRLGLLWARF